MRALLFKNWQRILIILFAVLSLHALNKIADRLDNIASSLDSLSSISSELYKINRTIGLK